MIFGRAESEWFKRDLKDCGGAMTITSRTMVVN
jgi:hypothetical protein